MHAFILTIFLFIPYIIGNLIYKSGAIEFAKMGADRTLAAMNSTLPTPVLSFLSNSTASFASVFSQGNSTVEQIGAVADDIGALSQNYTVPLDGFSTLEALEKDGKASSKAAVFLIRLLFAISESDAFAENFEIITVGYVGVAFGIIMWLLLAYLFKGKTSVENDPTIAKLAATAKFFYNFCKVIVMISFNFVVSPIFCALVLNLSTVEFFGATIQQRIAFLMDEPFFGIFIYPFFSPPSSPCRQTNFIQCRFLIFLKMGFFSLSLSCLS